MTLHKKRIMFDVWSYDPASGVFAHNLIESSDSHHEISLPEYLRLLFNHFVQHPDCLVTKRQASYIMWGDDQRDDNSVLRAICTLRKILKSINCSSIYIQTVRKRGFRFVVENSFVNEKYNVRTKHFQTVYRFLCLEKLWCSRRRNYFLIIVLFFVGVVIFISFSFVKDSVLFVKSDDVSNLVGTEFYPVISPDKKYIVYSNSVDRDSNFSIVIQSLNGGVKQIVKADKIAALNGFAWLKDMSGLFYQRVRTGSFCEIRKINFSKGTFEVLSDEYVSDCGLFSFSTQLHLSTDQRFLIFSTKPEAGGRTYIKKLALDSGVSHQLTTPLFDGFGDYNSSLSPDGKLLAFLRDKNFTHSQLWLLSLETGESTLVYEDQKYSPLMISWSLDQQKILWPNETNKVFAVDLKSKKLEFIMQADKPVVEIYEFKRNQYIATTGNYWNSTLWKVNNPATNSVLSRERVVNASLIDVFVIPNKAPSYPSAVLYAGSGNRQLSFYFPDGKQIAVKDIDITDRRTNGHFSSDGSTLLLRAGRQLWLVKPGEPSKRLPVTLDISSVFSWSSDGKSIYYSTYNLGQAKIARLSLEGGNSQILDESLRFYAESPDGKYTVQLRYGQPYLELVAKDTSKVMELREIKNPDLVMRRLILRSGGLYFTQKSSEAVSEVMRYNFNESKLETTGVTQRSSGRRLDVSLDEKFIYLDDGAKGNLEISILNEISN